MVEMPGQQEKEPVGNIPLCSANVQAVLYQLIHHQQRGIDGREQASNEGHAWPKLITERAQFGAQQSSQVQPGS